MGIGSTLPLLGTITAHLYGFQFVPFGYPSIVNRVPNVGMYLASTERPSEDREAPAKPEGDAYQRALVALEEATVLANTDPEPGIVALSRALAALHQFAPLLAADPDALARRTLAQLTLARAKLARGDEIGAAESMDAALRELADPTLPTAGMGPSLTQLYEQRRAALREIGTASLRIECAVACRAYVDERPLADDDQPVIEATLLLGRHRVWIASEDAAHDPLRATLELDEAGITLSYPPTEAPPPRLPAEPGMPGADTPDHSSKPSKRVMPRWAELALLGSGSAGLIAGSTLWAIDSKCPGGVDPHDIEACPELYDTRTAGIVLVTAGAAALLTGASLLIFDEARARRSARVTWIGATLQF